MKTKLWLAMAGLMGCSAAGAVSRDNDSVPGLPILRVVDGDDSAAIQRAVNRLIDAGSPFALVGDSQIVGEAMKKEMHAWPSTGAWVIDPREGLGVHAIQAEDEQARFDAFAAWMRTKGGDADPTVRSERARFHFPGKRNVALEFSAGTPGTVCRSFSRQMYDALFGNSLPDTIERRAFNSEVRRWCQYGDLSYYAGSTRAFVIEPFQDTRDALLTLSTEWAFIRSEDHANPLRVSYLMWTKTVGEGAGFGFTHRAGKDGYIDDRGYVHNLFDVAIHSGWGGLADRRTITAWPLNSTFPGMANTFVYECDGLDSHLRYDCPAQPRVRKLYPQDTHDGAILASKSTKFEVVGNARMSVGEKSASPKVTFGIDVMYGATHTSQVSMSMARIHTNADTVFHRSTRWIPDLEAIRRWHASYSFGGLAWATPLASTLNPEYEILWEIPLQGNEGRVIPYYTIYEAGWNTCNGEGKCAGWQRSRDGLLPSKARVAWFDAVMLRFPWH